MLEVLLRECDHYQEKKRGRVRKTETLIGFDVETGFSRKVKSKGGSVAKDRHRWLLSVRQTKRGWRYLWLKRGGNAEKARERVIFSRGPIKKHRWKKLLGSGLLWG